MSKRARRRAREAGGQYRRQPVAAASSGRPSLDSTRRALAIQLGCAGVLGLIALAGTAALGGTLAPLLVFLVVLGGAVAVWARTRAKLAGVALTDEDRLMQTLGAGLLAIAVVFALVAAIVLAVA